LGAADRTDLNALPCAGGLALSRVAVEGACASRRSFSFHGRSFFRLVWSLLGLAAFRVALDPRHAHWPCTVRALLVPMFR